MYSSSPRGRGWIRAVPRTVHETETDETPLDTALAALDDDRSRTGRVFAAAKALEGTGATLQDAFDRYARRETRWCFEPSSEVRRDLRAFCRVAHDQGYAVDAEAAVGTAVPDERVTVLRRGRAIRQSASLGPRERDQRLEAFLDDAREAGFDVDRRALDEYDPPPEADDGSDPPPSNPADLDALVRAAGTNTVTAGHRSAADHP